MDIRIKATGGEARVGIFDKAIDSIVAYEDTQGRTMLVPLNEGEWASCRIALPALAMAELSAQFLKQHGYLTREEYDAIMGGIYLQRLKEVNNE